MRDRPTVVCLCGSARFAEQIAAVARDLKLAGSIVLAPVPFDDAEPLTDAQRDALGTLHLARIDLADRVVVVSPGGYVGQSVRREIEHARRTGTPVEHVEGPCRDEP